MSKTINKLNMQRVVKKENSSDVKMSEKELRARSTNGNVGPTINCITVILKQISIYTKNCRHIINSFLSPSI